jgi:uncharacterized protein (TIGR00369 family)
VRGGYPDPGLFGLDGLGSLRAFQRGQSPAPPLNRLLGLEFGEVGARHATFMMPATRWLLNSAGVISGGVLAMAADAALGCALQTGLGPATPFTTSELSLTMVRPLRADGRRISANGQGVHGGRSVGLSEAFLLDERGGCLVAHSSSRLAIFPPLDPAPVPPRDPEPIDPPTDLDSDPYRRPVEGEVLGQEVWDAMNGLEVIQAQIRDEIPCPPISHLTGLEPVEAREDGSIAMRLPASEWLNSPARRVQGGAIAMLADAALVGAVETTAAAGTAVAGIDLKVNFLRPVQADGRDLIARGRVEHSGRKLAIADAELFNADHERVALATGSSMFLPGHPADLGEIELGRSEGEEGDEA